MYKYLHMVILILVFIPASFSMTKAASAAIDKIDAPPEIYTSFARLEKTFTSHGNRLKAWLYLPTGPKPPILVMAHGFGGQRWMRLPAYAEQFARRGIAVFLFDYRGFNDSEGEPRNYINPSRHLEDWDAAIAYVKKLDTVDAQRMALWGTSFSGGHVIVEAAKHPHIRAVISQVPFTDGIATMQHYITNDPIFAIKGMYHGMADLLASLFTDHRHTVRIAGRPGEEFAIMCQPDTMAGMMKILGNNEKRFEKDNYCPANIILTLGLYRPISDAEMVACPTLVIGAETDTLFPPTGPKKMADRIKKATYISMPMNHFEPYVGKPFEQLVNVMGDFLISNLKDSPHP